jgi:hypothetical protein
VYQLTKVRLEDSAQFSVCSLEAGGRTRRAHEGRRGDQTVRSVELGGLTGLRGTRKRGRAAPHVSSIGLALFARKPFAFRSCRSESEIVLAGDDFAAGFPLEFLARMAGDGPAFAGGVPVLHESSGVAAAGDFRSRGLPQHGEDELKVAHVVAEVLAVEFFVARVFGGSEAEGGQGDVCSEDGVFALFFDPALFPFPGEFIADGDGAHALLDPVVGIAFGFVEGAGAFGGQLGILDLLDAFVTDFGQPALEGLGFGAGDRLNEAEEAFGVGAVELLRPPGGFYQKGGGNLPPPFGKLGVTAAHIFDVALGIDGIRERGNDIGDDKTPFVVMDGAAHFLALEEGDAPLGRVGGGSHGKKESGRWRWKSRIIDL